MSQNNKMRTAGKKRPSRKRQPSFLMPLLFVVGSLLVAGAIFLALNRKDEGMTTNPSFEPQVSGSPSLATETTLIDLGDITLGQWVTASFDVTNVGDKTLTFTEAPYIQLAAGC